MPRTRTIVTTTLGLLLATLPLVGCGDASETPAATAPAAAEQVAGGNPPAASVPSSTGVSAAASSSAVGSEDLLVPGGYIRVVPSAFELGAVAPGSVHPMTFSISNMGTEEVVIISAQPSCVCTTLTNLAGARIPPGGSIEMAASLDAPKQPGEKEAKVFLRVQGADRPATVRIKGMVTLPIQPTPPYAEALKGVTSGVIDLASTDGRPFSVLASNGRPPMFVGFDPSKDAPRAAYRIRWSIEGMTPSAIPRWWIFTTDRPECVLVPCRVRNENTGARRDMARMQRHWIIEDDFVDLGEVRLGVPVEVSCVIKHYNPRGGGRVEQADWWQAQIVQSASQQSLRAEFAGLVRLDDERAEVRMKVTPIGSPSELMNAFVEIRTATGGGVLEFAAKVVR
jgi:hypothetical protein